MFKSNLFIILIAIAGALLCIVATVAGGMTGIVALIASSFFMSIMYPTIFAESVDGLGARTKSAAALLVMAIVGGAFFPAVMGLVWLTTPSYIDLLFTERAGNLMLGGCAVWMSIGIFVMRNMINFKR